MKKSLFGAHRSLIVLVEKVLILLPVVEPAPVNTLNVSIKVLCYLIVDFFDVSRLNTKYICLYLVKSIHDPSNLLTVIYMCK